MIATPQTKTYTAEEYLALEVEADTRSEYRDGEITPMSGGTPEHNAITGDLLVLLKLALKKQPYAIFMADQRLALPNLTNYTYPDVMVLPKPIELQPGRKDTITNPVFIAEVLSESTQNYDRTDKFAAYRSIPTFQEYLLIDQYRFYVEHYVKQAENQWLFTEYSDLQALVKLSSIPVEIAIADLYENVEL